MRNVPAAITHVGPNSILQISLFCNKIKSRNTRDPIQVWVSLTSSKYSSN